MINGSYVIPDYRRIEKIGEGTYGVVYKALDTREGKFVALKRIRLQDESEGVPSTTIREISVLRTLQHPNIVRLYDIVYCDHRIYLVFEYLDRDLKRLMEGYPNGLPLHICNSYLKQLLSGIAYCHAKLILHRDLKPQNLLVDNQGTIKIADFGLARSFQIPIRVFTNEVVTLWYRAPELLLNIRMYSTAVDVWSLGCIFAELLTGRTMFPGDSEIDQLYRIFRTLGTPTEDTWPGAFATFPEKVAICPCWPSQDLSISVPKLDTSGLNLLSKMLTCYPKNRISAVCALNDVFLRDISLPRETAEI